MPHLDAAALDDPSSLDFLKAVLAAERPQGHAPRPARDRLSPRPPLLPLTPDPADRRPLLVADVF